MTKVGFGILFPDLVWPDTNRGEPLDQLRACIERCEYHDFDIWVAEHLVDAPGLYGASWLDPLVFLGFAAALTTKVRLGTQILVAPIRQPVVAAKQIASLQELCAGRFELGIGVGWNAKEYQAVGVSMSDRGRRTDEVLDALEVLLTEERANYEGRYYRFDDISIRPRHGMPRLWAAGGSRLPGPGSPDPPSIHPNVLRRVLRAGNWMSRAAARPESIAQDWRAIQTYAREQGADPSAVTFGHLNFFHIAAGVDRDQVLRRQTGPFTRLMGTARPLDVLRTCYLMGTTADIIERLQALIGYGCTYFCLGPTSADPVQIDLLASEIIPSVV